MNVLRNFLVATLAAVVMMWGANSASAAGNRLGTIDLNKLDLGNGYAPSEVHYPRRYRRYWRKRRYYRKRRHYRHGYYRPYRYKRRHSRRYRRHYRRYHGPSVYFHVPGFGLYFRY